MIEINPVLAGKYDATDFAASTTNINTQANPASEGVDSRRYTKFDRSASEVQTADLHFSDLIDTLNPLQHIPVISSVYRAITGENINPVARIVGDTLYGGVLGGASALLAAAGAVSDSAVEAATGKTTSGVVIAALFGSDDAPATATAPETKVAEAAPAPPASEPAPPVSAPINAVESVSVSVSASVSAPVPAPDSAATSIPTASAAPAATSAPEEPKAMAAVALPEATAKAYPLNRSKLPFGGVMDTSRLNPVIAQPSGVQGEHSVRLGSKIFPAGVGNNVYTLPAAIPASPPAPSVAGQGTASEDAPHADYQLPKALLDEIAAMKAVSQYQSTASAPALNGSSLDIVN